MTFLLAIVIVDGCRRRRRRRVVVAVPAPTMGVTMAADYEPECDSDYPMGPMDRDLCQRDVQAAARDIPSFGPVQGPASG